MKININRDITQIRESLWNDFGAKQILYLIVGVACGAAAYLLAYKTVPPLLCGYLAALASIPIIFLGFYKKNGMNALQYMRASVQANFARPLRYQSTEEISGNVGKEKKSGGFFFFKQSNKKTGKKPNKKKGKIVFDRLSKYMDPDESLYPTPKSVQQTLEFVAVAENGIFRLSESRWSKSYLFYDANYTTEDDSGKNDVLDAYERFLSSMNVRFKITIHNRERKKVEDEFFFLRLRGDELDSFRELHNEQFQDKMEEGTHGLVQERYFTITIEKADYEAAKTYFATLEASLKDSFQLMGSILVPLNAAERLNILYGLSHTKSEEGLEFNYKEWAKQKRDVKNDICNTRLKFYPDYIEDEEKWSRVLYVKGYPRKLTDKFINELVIVPAHSMISIDVVPISNEDTLSILNNKYLGIEETIRRQQKKRNQQNNFSSEISHTKMRDKRDIQEMLDAVNDDDETLFTTSVTILIHADSKKELDALTESFKLVGNGCGCKIGVLELQQREGLNTVLPIGIRQIRTMRTMLTGSLAALHPFNVQELNVPDEDALWYGINDISKNTVRGNRKRLTNPGGWIFGVPGSGKSMNGKLEFGQVRLNTDDEIIILDPQNEYVDIVKRYGGNVVDIYAGSDIRMNPLDRSRENTSISDLIAEKTDYILSHCAVCKEEPLTARERGVISRCTKQMFTNSKTELTMTDVYKLLKEQPEPEAEDLALYLEPFTNGTMDMFAHKSNVRLDNRLTCFGLNKMDKNLRPLGMLVAMTYINNRVAENFKKGVATWIYFDEAHVFLKDKETSDFLVTSWKIWRKFGGIPTGITQNAVSLIDSPQFETLIGNSEFILLLKQSPTDCRYIAKNFELTESKIRYMKNTEPGKGLLLYGGKQIVFDATISKESDLYTLYNTNFHEKAERMKTSAI